MLISPISPIGPAWHRMVRILFKPFDLTKWFVLGFCAFLAQCGEGGGSSPPWSGGGQQPSVTGEWFDQNIALVIVIAAVVLVVVIALGFVVLWLSSRGKFMFIDGVAKNRGAVREPWREFKREGNSLFLFRIMLGLISLVALALAIGIPFAIAIPDFQSERFGAAGITAIVIGSILLLLFFIAAIAVRFMLNAFVVPTMYCRRVRVLEGWRIAWREIVRGHIGSAIVVFLMLIVLGMLAAVLAVIATCATCCLTILPYIGAVILLPIPVFFTAYLLEYIQQFGPEWRFFSDDMCAKCGYIKTEGSSATCPECGFSTAPTP